MNPGLWGLEIVRTREALRGLELPWRKLPARTPFQRPEWLLPWWDAFSQPELRVVVFLRDGGVAGVLPLYLYADPVRGERQLLLVGAGTSDYLDGCFDRELPEGLVREALGRLAEEDGWDVAHLTQLVAGSPLLAVCRSVAGAREYAGEPTSRMAALPVAELPKKVRADVRYFRNAALGRGRLELQVATAETCVAMFELLVKQHTARWRLVGEPGVLADPAVLRWHREMIPGLEAAGLLRFYGLVLAGETIATLYALIDAAGCAERTLYLYLIGHSEAHAHLHPGTLLTAMAAEAAAAEGVRTVDMLRGDEVYKRFWRVSAVSTYGFAIPRTALPGANGF